MADIHLRNSMTRQVERFEPINPDNIRMYVCGPTVYDRAHLGNARPAVVFDMLFRLLRHVYGAKHVTYARNFTDVDDKINARAAETNRPISDITDETIGWYLDDMGALGVMEPTHMPRATDYIQEMIDMIETLIADGYAYAAQGHVLFSVEKYADYGRLSGRSLNDMIAGARVEVAPYKHNPMDFVLWKPSDENTPRWGSPWGYGRPGWHIECSAMAKQLLGDHFDIHGGGNDLMFPHHENEIAQSCCANHGRDFANIWMHNEMLQVEGKKMSKSLGNFFTVRDLLNQGIPGEVIRFVMLSTHYTKPMDWTKDKAKQAENTLHHWHKVTLGLDPTPENEFQPDEKLIAALSDDLNTHLALTYLRALQAQPQKLLDHARFMGFLGDDARTEFAEIEQRFSVGSANSVQLANLAQRLDGIWKDAKQRKDFTKVDAMKANLVAAGVQVKMSNTGVELTPGPDFDAQKLETL